MSRAVAPALEEKRQESAPVRRRHVKGTRVTAAQARKQLGDLLRRIATGRERFVIEDSDGRVIGALVTRKDLVTVVEDEEDREDIVLAEKALADPADKNIPIEQVRREMDRN